MPRFAADQLPTTKLGLALSLADRLDTLVGIFAIGQKPSGVKDPFKLRRHALAVVRLLIATPAPLNLSTWITEAQRIYGDKLQQKESILPELKPFILERLQSHYHGLGFGTDLVLAVRARQDEWLYDLDKRIHALATFVKLPEAQALSAACKRVSNILNQAKRPENGFGEFNKALLEEGAERALFDQLLALEEQIKPLYAKAEYEKILSQLASLREPVDAFFDRVMVMVDDEALKTNRLQLLARLQLILQGVADISLLALGTYE
jgi:glycyl-tRNA synthetase beta chain